MKLLNRNIRGRQESLAPLFVIGGVYPVANPFFLGRIAFEANKPGYNINIEGLRDVLDTTFAGYRVGDGTYIGYVSGVFDNQDGFKELTGDRAVSVEQFFAILKEQVSTYFGVGV